MALYSRVTTCVPQHIPKWGWSRRLRLQNSSLVHQCQPMLLGRYRFERVPLRHTHREECSSGGEGREEEVAACCGNKATNLFWHAPQVHHSWVVPSSLNSRRGGLLKPGLSRGGLGGTLWNVSASLDGQQQQRGGVRKTKMYSMHTTTRVAASACPLAHINNLWGRGGGRRRRRILRGLAACRSGSLHLVLSSEGAKGVVNRRLAARRGGRCAKEAAGRCSH